MINNITIGGGGINFMSSFCNKYRANHFKPNTSINTFPNLSFDITTKPLPKLKIVELYPSYKAFKQWGKNYETLILLINEIQINLNYY